jgi:regulator of sigma E protease
LDHFDASEREDRVTPSSQARSAQSGSPPNTADSDNPLVGGIGPWILRNAFSLLLMAAVFIWLYNVFGGEGMWSIVKAALGLGFVIFLHELGHFAVAKWCDVHVETFSIGFGPALPGCSFQRGETTYKIALFPLGGYVKMIGEGAESEEDDDNPRSFKNKSVWQRMAIISAGVTMNVLLGFACFIVSFMGGVGRSPGIVDLIESGSPAWRKGIPTGAHILQIGSAHDPYFDDLQPEVMLSHAGEKLTLVYEPLDQPGKLVKIQIEPRRDKDDTRPVIGISPPNQLKLRPRARGKLQRPVLYASAAAFARQPFDLRPGDTIVATTDPDHPDQVSPLPTPLPGDRESEYQHAQELHRRWQLLADMPMVVQVRRQGARPEDSPVEFHVAPAEFRFGDQIVAMTDPDHPETVTTLAPRADSSADYFEYERRLHRLAGQMIVFRVRDSEGQERELMVPPAYNYRFGMRMRMGPVTAVREESPAAKAGVIARQLDQQIQGDILDQVEVDGPDGGKIRFVSTPSKNVPPGVTEKGLDPMRLPSDLEQWAAQQRAPRRVTLTVLRKVGHAERQPVRLETEWDDNWKFDRAAPVGRASPLPLSGLGLAYQVETIVEAVEPASPAEKAGVKKGDVIRAIRFQEPGKKPGESVPGEWVDLEADQWAHVLFSLQQFSDSKEVTFRIEREKQPQEFALSAQPDFSWPRDERGLLLLPDTRIQQASTFASAVTLGVQRTYRSIVQIYLNLRAMMTGRVSTKTLGGPLTIANVAYIYAGESFFDFVLFLGIISVNLAVINFLPIPVLDGGHMVFLVYEKLRGRPASEQVRIAATYVGLMLIVSLMIFVIYLDVKRGWF